MNSVEINKSPQRNMRSGMQQLFFTGLLMSLMLFVSCSASRKSLKEPLKDQGAEFLVSKMLDNQIYFDYLTARFTAEIYENKTSLMLNGQLRMKKDSLVWISVSPSLNIEMGRMIITGDSLKWVNRLQSNYLLAPIDRLANLLHPALGFDLAQAFILGNDLTLFDDKSFNTSLDKGKYKMSVKNRKLRKLIKDGDKLKTLALQELWLNPKNFRITKVIIQDKESAGSPQIEASYSEFIPVGKYMFAVRQRYQIKRDESNLVVNINFTKVELQPAAVFPFSVPEKYKPVNTL